MPSLWTHLGITIATFVGNSYFNIGGPLKYGTNLMALSSTMLVLMRNKVLVPFMLLPSIYMSNSPEHIPYINRSRARIQSSNPDTCTFFQLTTKDNVKLDAMTLIHPDHQHATEDLKDTKWMIWFNPNGAAYEELLDFLEVYTADVGVSLLAFNYRGVSRSEGLPQIADDIVTDGQAAMDYLLKRGVASKDILLHGHSMGGAVATRVRAMYPDGPIINDRSFRSLNHVVLALSVSEPALGALTGGLVGATLGGVLGGTIFSSYSAAFSSTFVGLVLSGFLGYKWGDLHAPIIKLALAGLEWNFDIEKSWSQITGHKVIIYHKLDGVISHERASMFSAVDMLTDKQGTKFMRLEYEHHEQRQPITNKHQVYHVYPLNMFPNDWELITQEAKIGLGI